MSEKKGTYYQVRALVFAAEGLETLMSMPASTMEDRSTHFDDVRLTRRDITLTAAPAVAPSRLDLVASPNPFRERTELSFRRPIGTARLDVHDATGLRDSWVNADRIRQPHQRPQESRADDALTFRDLDYDPDWLESAPRAQLLQRLNSVCGFRVGWEPTRSR